MSTNIYFWTILVDDTTYNEPPGLGASLLPAEALRTQENVLNGSSENIHKMAAAPHVKRAFASPEKERVHSPTISPQSQVFFSPIKNSGKELVFAEIFSSLFALLCSDNICL